MWTPNEVLICKKGLNCNWARMFELWKQRMFELSKNLLFSYNIVPDMGVGFDKGLMEGNIPHHLVLSSICIGGCHIDFH